MQLYNRFANHVRYASSSKLIVAALFVVLTGIALSATLVINNTRADAASCGDNDIVRCGFGSAGDFVAKYNANSAGDLPAIYQAFGLSSNELDRFARTAKPGTAYKNGTIVVDGKVVATDATSLGRNAKSYSSPININGKTYHESRSQDVFLSNSIPAYVMMNGEQFEFAALTACGNPLHGKPTGEAPKYSCDLLKATEVNRTTYKYSTDVTALHGVAVSKLVYEFGDGTSQTVTNADQEVTHTFAKDGSYTTKVTVYVSVNGETITATGPQCSKPIEVRPVPPTPKYACDALSFTTISQANRQYRFTAKTSQSGGAVLKNASFNFGDSVTLNDVSPSDASTVSAEHTYAQVGNYTIVATVNFSVAGGVQSVTCQTAVSPANQPPAECKPGIPVGDSRCTEQPKTPDTPAKLPDTGAADMIGGAIGSTSILGAGSYLYRSRRNLLSTFWKK